MYTHKRRTNWLGVTLGSGDGRSKKEAEVAAAREAMLQRKWISQPVEETATAVDGKDFQDDSKSP